jgi:hypothetical protein
MSWHLSGMIKEKKPLNTFVRIVDVQPRLEMNTFQIQVRSISA